MIYCIYCWNVLKWYQPSPKDRSETYLPSTRHLKRIPSPTAPHLQQHIAKLETWKRRLSRKKKQQQISLQLSVQGTVTYNGDENSRTYSESHTLWFCPGLGSEWDLWRVTAWCNSSLPLECTDLQTCHPRPCWADSESWKKDKTQSLTLKMLNWSDFTSHINPNTYLNVKKRKALGSKQPKTIGNGPHFRRNIKAELL